MPPSRSFVEYCADLADANMRLDAEDSERAYEGLVARGKTAGPAELTDGLARLTPALEQVALGNGGMLAQVAGSVIHAGADPLPVLDLLVGRVAAGLEQAARLAPFSGEMGDELAEPTTADEAAAVFDRVARVGGFGADEAATIAECWFTVGQWIPGLLVPLQEKRVRRELPQRERLVAAATATEKHVDGAHWLLGLALVLDDESLIVVHRATGRAYELTISGIGDNFQLHTLLAATLIGDPAEGLIAGKRPAPDWIAAATDGEPQPAGGIGGQFNLVDAAGEWIWNEGRPSDIPFAGERRVVVIDPPPYQRGWNAGRAYPMMVPEIQLERVLPADEAAGWASRVTDRSGPG
jgi:hypothetical protein